jgi:hypothetical protein
MSRLMIASLVMAALCLASTSAQDKDKKEEVKKAGGANPFGVQIFKDKKDGAVKDGKTAQPKVAPRNQIPPAIPGDVEVHFLNGSKVRMIVQSEALEVKTLYGNLAVPVKDIRAIEFGIHFPAGVEGKIEESIKALSSNDYRIRETATKTLQDLAPYSYPAVLNASRTKELESASRAKDIVTKLRAKHPAKDLKSMAEDKIVTNTFTIVGRITTTIKAKEELFGDLVLPMAKMRSLRAMGGASPDVEVGVDASKYANAGQWMDTNYLVDGRSTIVITARGMIDVWPQQGGNFMSGPNGFNATRNGMPFMGAGKRVGGVNQNQHCGMLLGRIGEQGEIFTIGERYEGTPETEGNLFLHIGPSQWNVQSVGTYEVKIGRKGD